MKLDLQEQACKKREMALDILLNYSVNSGVKEEIPTYANLSNRIKMLSEQSETINYCFSSLNMMLSSM